MIERSGKIAFIQIAPTAGQRLVALQEVRAVAGQGLEGDHHFKSEAYAPGTGRELTLIELESVEALRRDLRIQMEPAQTRRNIVTRDVPLNHLVGRQFRLGREVIVQGVRLCEPCDHLERLSLKGVREGLLHRAGLRCDIIKGGTVRVGDLITYGTD